jgi:DNA polymerase III sliding clamp (beta) subunit (PCNA family)
MATSEEESRYTLNGVLYDISKKRLVATDGHMLAIIPHEVEDADVGGVIPTDAFKEARKLAKKAKKRKTELAILQEQDTITFSVEGLQSATFDSVKGVFPEYEKIIPKKIPPFTVALNAELLYKLAMALTEESMIVHLHIAGPDQAIVVRPSAAKDSIGLLMPCRAFGEESSPGGATTGSGDGG